MQQCVSIARRLAERVGGELGIPVFLYEEAATRAERRSLSDIRRGEYEGLARKLAQPEWRPDFGPAAFHATSGATVIGARQFLIAYNINLNSTDKNHASDIAFALRDKGRVARAGNTAPYYSRGKKQLYREGAFPCGSCGFLGTDYASTRAHVEATHRYDLDALLAANDLDPPNVVGKQVYRPGLFRACKAIGWYVDDYQRAQISINLTDYHVTPPHAVLEASRALAAERGLVVTGSEIVGLVPLSSLVESGRYYLAKQGRTLGQPLPDVLRAAVSSLGLADVAPFDVTKKVLGLPVRSPKALVGRTVVDFTDEVSRDSPAPGGGSVAALAGALGAALASMVANLTYGKEGSEANDAELARIAEEAQRIKDALIHAVDADSDAFAGFMEALRLPQGSAEDKALRTRRMQEGLKAAVEVPWQTASSCLAAMRLARRVSEIGNPNSLSDGAVGVQIAFAGVRGGLWNVLINLKDITDAAFVDERRAGCESTLAEARLLADDTGRYIDERMLAAIDKAADRRR